jgi:predicted trehalose synthase
VFLAGYRAAIGDCPSFPRNEALFKQLIEIFVLEKTLYEIVMGPPIARAIFHRPGS